MTLGERIRIVREKAGLSQKELAEKLNISTSIIALWESNEEIPSINDISNISDVLNISIDSLLKSEKVINNTSNRIKLLSLSLTFLLIISGVLYSLIIFVFPVNNNKNISLDDLTSSVVKINCYDYFGEETATGSGFVAFDDSIIITNYHVIKEAYTCKISTEDDVTLNPNRIVCYSKNKDIAILRLSEPSGVCPLNLGESVNVKKGDKVTAIGSPLGIKNNVSEGIISGIIKEDEMDVINFTAPISSGSSGGALFDDNGNVIGITYASYTEGQNLNLAIPIDEVKDLYVNEKHDYKINRIYTTNHPFIHHLEEYNEIIHDVSLDELRTNPKKYNNKKIRVKCYVSSIRRQQIMFEDSVTRVYSVTDNVRLISDSVENDYLFSQINSIKTSNILLMDTVFTGFYEPKGLIPGDYICIIGTLVYYKKGEEAYDTNDHLCTLQNDQIRIDKDIVYKID